METKLRQWRHALLHQYTIMQARVSHLLSISQFSYIVSKSLLNSMCSPYVYKQVAKTIL